MQIMKLTATDGREVFANMDHLVLIEGLGTYTRLTFTSEVQVSVKESPHHIIGGLPGPSV